MLPPAPLTARLVFMADKASFLSRLVMWDTMGACSHVAAMMDDGLFMTANIGEGVRRKRQEDEFDGVSKAISVDIPMGWPMYKEWREFLYSKDGVPFDTGGLIGISTNMILDEHTIGDLYCASLQIDALRHCGYFPRPLAQKWHMISPVVLLLMLQARPLAGGLIVHEAVTA